MKKIFNAIDFGVRGDGIQDETPFLQEAVNAAKGNILTIPDGTYRIVDTLKLPSDTEIHASEHARIFHCGSKQKKRGDFLVSNQDVVNGNENISICGGIWDGNFDGINNDKHPDLFCEDAWSGSMFNFQHVKNLHLENMKIVNSVVFYVRMGKVDTFHIENIELGAEKLSYNQDGLHFGGGCRNGVVRNIRCLDNETNDDLIALNADDSIVRLENRDLTRDDIENILFENIFADNCYTFTRMLSVTHSIRNITFRNIHCGCRVHAINMDAARYCRTPLFKEEEFPDGCGNIENIIIEGMHVYASEAGASQPLIVAETRCKNFCIKDFKRDMEKDAAVSPGPTIFARNLKDTVFGITEKGEEQEYLLKGKADVLEKYGTFEELRIETQGM